MAIGLKEGYYWWQEKEGSKHELCLVRKLLSDVTKMEVKFFDGARMTLPGWGIFTEAIIEIPEGTR